MSATARLAATVVVLREAAGASFDLAIQLGLGLPFGSAAAFTNATPLAFAPRVGVGKSMLGWLRLGAELGFMVRGTPAALAGTGTASAFTFSIMTRILLSWVIFSSLTPFDFKYLGVRSLKN